MSGAQLGWMCIVDAGWICWSSWLSDVSVASLNLSSFPEIVEQHSLGAPRASCHDTERAQIWPAFENDNVRDCPPRT